MEICRICCNNGRHMQPIFKSTKSPTIAEMIAGIAKVKIWKGDGQPDNICQLCKDKLSEAYTFKMQIERSDRIFRNMDDDKKQITFNDLTDLLVEIQSLNPELLYDCKIENNEDLKICFDVKQNLAYYNDTVIKGLDVKEINNKGYGVNCNPAICVEYFLDTIKHDFDNYNDDFVAQHDYNDDDYIPPSKSTSHKKIEKHKKKKLKGLKKRSKFKPIKPIILEDLKLVSSKGRYKTRQKGEGQKRLKYGRGQICPYCGRIIKAMKLHLMTHTEQKSFNCLKCPKSFYRENNLREHMKLHTGEKDFKCHLCVAAFHNKMLLRSHLISHANIRKFICQVCSKGFKRKCALKKHEMRHSSANRIYKCDECNMSCFEKWQLKHHMRVHTRERPYNCEICNQAYSYKHDFNNHCFKKHGVFVKGRSINVMNEVVLFEERALMREVLENGGPVDPFKGPRAAIQYQLAVSALSAKVMSDIKLDYVI